MRPRAIAAGLAVGTIMGINFDLLISLHKFIFALQGGPWFLPALALTAIAIPLLALVITLSLIWAVNFIDPHNNIEVTKS